MKLWYSMEEKLKIMNAAKCILKDGIEDAIGFDDWSGFSYYPNCISYNPRNGAQCVISIHTHYSMEPTKRIWFYEYGFRRVVSSKRVQIMIFDKSRKHNYDLMIDNADEPDLVEEFIELVATENKRNQIRIAKKNEELQIEREAILNKLSSCD